MTFAADSLLFVVTYDEQTYFVEKEKLNEFSFLDRPVAESGLYLIPKHEFSINTFDFKVVAAKDTDEQFDYLYPECFGMIAVSDTKKSIAYLYFNDIDLDYISENATKGTMSEFVNDYFEYNW